MEAQLPPADRALDNAPGQTVGFVVLFLVDVSRVSHWGEQVRPKRIATVSEEPPLSPGGCSQPSDGGLAEHEGVVSASRPFRYDIQDDALMVAHHLAVDGGISLPTDVDVAINVGRENWNQSL